MGIRNRLLRIKKYYPPRRTWVEYAVPGRSPTIVDTWRLFKTSSSARKVLAPLIIIPFKCLFKLCQCQYRIFGFARRPGISTGTGSYQIKWEIVMLKLFFPAKKRKKGYFNERIPTFSFSFASFSGQITKKSKFLGWALKLNYGILRNIILSIL